MFKCLYSRARLARSHLEQSFQYLCDFLGKLLNFVSQFPLLKIVVKYYLLLNEIGYEEMILYIIYMFNGLYIWFIYVCVCICMYVYMWCVSVLRTMPRIQVPSSS